jgi:hypothetical protein
MSPAGCLETAKGPIDDTAGGVCYPIQSGLRQVQAGATGWHRRALVTRNNDAARRCLTRRISRAPTTDATNWKPKLNKLPSAMANAPFARASIGPTDKYRAVAAAGAGALAIGRPPVTLAASLNHAPGSRIWARCGPVSAAVM